MKNLDQFIDTLTQKTEADPQMLQATIELTYGCNLRCVHCYNPTHSARNEMTREDYFRVLDGLVEQGCLWVFFTGGEVFTRPDALEIMRYAKSRGLIISIFSNATRITPDLADALKDLAPYQIDVSMYGATAAAYEAVTRIPGSYADFVSGLTLLSDRKIPVMLKLILMTLNAQEWEVMRDFAVSRGLPYKISTEIHPRVDGSRDPLAYRLSSEKAFEIWKTISGEGQRATRQTAGDTALESGCGGAGKLFDCMCGKNNAAITPYGKMNLCVSMHHPQFDLKQGTLQDGWHTLVDLVTSTQPGPTYECSGCHLAVQCTRGSDDSWLEYRAFDAPCIPHYREMAELKIQFLDEPQGGPHGKCIPKETV